MRTIPLSESFRGDAPDAPPPENWAQACLHALILRRTAERPEAVALVFHDQHLSYGVLAERIGQLTQLLRRQEVSAETAVGICLERGPDLVAALLATLAAGGAYVSLDPTLPPGRLAQLLETSGTYCVLTRHHLLPRLGTFPGPIIDLDTASGRVSCTPVIAAPHPDQLAYIVHTSGSSGTPKGILGTHGSAAGYVRFLLANYELHDTDTVLQLAAASFDSALRDLVTPLVAGTRVVLLDDTAARDPATHLAAICRWRVSALLSVVPSLLQRWLTAETEESIPASIRLLLLAGESVPRALARRAQRVFGPQARIVNHYGPSETTCTACAHTLPVLEDANALQETDAVPIGQPHAHVTFSLLGADLAPVTPGTIGELYLGGSGLSRGYLHQPAATAARFLPDSHAPTPGARRYRSGDLARQLPDGTLVFAGRIDRQLKIRGLRVEPGEIEAALGTHPEVAAAAVVARAELPADRPLVAYTESSRPDAVSTSDLQRFLAARLPEPMLPGAFVHLAALPRTPNGKVDYLALPRPLRATTGRASPPPSTPLESYLASLWCQILGRKKVGVEDDFFALGGTSLDGAALINRLQRALDVIIHVVAIFDAPTVRTLALYLTTHYPAAVGRRWGTDPAIAKADDDRADKAAAARFEAALPRLAPAVIRQRANPPMLFILAPPRSGTTLLRVMLAGHPQLFAPPQLELLPYPNLGARRSAFTGRQRFRREGTIRALMAIHGCSADQAGQLLTRMEDEDLTIQAFYRQLQGWLGGRLLVDNTPSYALDPAILARAEALFDQPRYLYLLRHPNAVIHSFVEAHLDRVLHHSPPGCSRRALAELHWQISHRNIQHFLRDVPAARQHRLRFETLVRSPERTMTALCAFLGLAFHPAMVRPYDNLSRRMADGLRSGMPMLGDVKLHHHRGIDGGVADRWRRHGGASLLAPATQGRAAALGYDLPATTSALLPLPRAGTRQRLPLSFAQRRLWFLHQLEPASPAYNIAAAFRLTGPLDENALAQALDALMAHHAVLRTTFPHHDDGPQQVIVPHATVPLSCLDLTALPDPCRACEAQRLMAAEAARPFDLARGPLLRAWLLRCRPTQRLFLLTVHHIVSDGSSQRLLHQQLGALYERLRRGEKPQLSTSPLTYADFAVWQRQTLTTAALAPHLTYWRTQLEGLPPLHLPTDRQRSTDRPHPADRHDLALSSALSTGLLARCRAAGTTLYATTLTAFFLLLQRLSGRADIAVGAAVAGRGRPEQEGMLGCFTNLLVWRGDLQGNPTCEALLARIRHMARDAHSHQEVPFEKLVEIVTPHRDRRQPLVSATFALRRDAPPAPQLQGVVVETLPIPRPRARFDLELHLWESAGRLRGTFFYDRGLFDATTIARWTRLLGHLLTTLAFAPGRRLSELGLPDVDRHQLLAAWNDSTTTWPPEGSVQASFLAWTARTPDAVAVAGHGTLLTYGSLARLAGRLAERLRPLGVGPETRVGICLDPSPELVVSQLAVLATGGAYVPLDPTYPISRLHTILADAAPTLVLTRTALLRRGLLPVGAIPLFVLDEGWRSRLPAVRSLPAGGSAAQAAYVLYTSGSTGQPKGVVVPHRALDNHMHWMQRALPLRPTDAVLQKTPLGFDAAVWEFWAPLMAGACLLFAPAGAHRDGARLLRIAEARRATVLQVVPTLLQALVAQPARGGSTALRWVLAGGEALAATLRDRFLALLPNTALINGYGPTEATIHASVDRCRKGESEVMAPIGKPLANARLYVLDALLQPVPPGTPGQLFIGGAGQARGYLHNPGLTAARFVPDPFSRKLGRRLYQSGDRVRWLSDGRLTFLGRLDRQLKLHGLRFEPAEVEAAIAAHPEVGQAVVLLDTAPAGPRLDAYVVPRGNAKAPSSRALRSFLRHRLPAAAVPARFIPLLQLPRTPGGKLDRTALPLPYAESPEEGTPRAPSEEILAELWAEVLGLPQVGIHDNVFALGAHSLVATQIVSRLRRVCNVELPLGALFAHPTVAELAPVLDRALGREALPAAPPLQPMPRADHPPLSFAQQRLWFLDRLTPWLVAYNMSSAFRLVGHLDVAALIASLAALTKRHGVLRTRFPSRGGRPYQKVEPVPAVPLPEVDLSALEPHRRTREARHLAHREARRPFDLRRSPLFRPLLLRHGTTAHDLLLNLHHITADGWSLGVLRRELSLLYGAGHRRRSASLPPLSLTYTDFAAWQRTWLRGAALDGHLIYWRQNLRDLPTLSLPIDRPRPADQRHRGATHAFTLPAPLTSALRRLGVEVGVSLYMTLLAGFMTVLHRLSGEHDIVVGSPIAQRTRQEVEGLIGFFVNTLVMRGNLKDDPPFHTLLERVRETTLGAYTHQDLPFERLVEALQPNRVLDRHPLFQVAFALQNEPRSPLTLDGVQVQSLPLDPGRARFDLELFLHEEDGSLHGRLVYDRDLFLATTIARLAQALAAVLSAAAACPDRRLGALALLSAAQRHQLLCAWGSAPAGAEDAASSFYCYFAARAARTPDAVALVQRTPGGGETRLTYSALESAARTLGHHLRRRGIGPEVSVGLFLARAPALVIGLLGVLAAGGAYLPLSRSAPPARRRALLAAAGTRLVLTDGAGRGALPPELETVIVDGRCNQVAAEGALPSPQPVQDNAVYLLFTSGSTGDPKGVVVTHRGLLRYVRWAALTYGMGPGKRALVPTNLSADLTLTGLLLPLVTGGTVELLAEDAEPESLETALARQDCALLKLTPTHLRLLAAAGVKPRTSTLVVGGEALLSTDLPSNTDAMRCFNEYGPTEAVVGCICQAIGHADPGALPIGRPRPGVRVYVRDPQLRPVPLGAPGELHIGGAGLARGYLAPAPTAAVFLPDPAGQPGSRAYRSGDRVRFLADGALLFLGRLDRQVKVRGFRVEPGEVEAALLAHPGVQDAVVTWDSGEVGAGQLTAYVVPAADRPQTAQTAQIAHWRVVYDDLYRPPASPIDPAFDITGWTRSHDGLPFPATEMREWLDGAVVRILALAPRRVLEIGCGTGLVFHRVAPRCERYQGTDLAAPAIAALRQRLGTSLPQVELAVQPAHDFRGIDRGAFDTVILNSVVQYFPSIDYLLEVLRGAVVALAPGGALFLGDLRSLPLLDAYCASVELARAAPSLPLQALVERMRRRRLRQRELVLDPAFFSVLYRSLPRLAAVRIEPKLGRAANELNRFRYDVTLHLDHAPPGPDGDIQWLEDAVILEEHLRLGPQTLVLRRLPDRRVQRVLELLAHVRAPSGLATVAALEEALEKLPANGCEPADLVARGAKLGYEMGFHTSADGTFDALFYRATTGAPRPLLPVSDTPTPPRPWRCYGNDPLRNQIAAELEPRLRDHLATLLPPPMVPARTVVLEALPRLASGKVDRRALPASEALRPALIVPRAMPRTAAEKTLAGIWCQLLGLESIGIHDDFFALGGDSILSIQVVARARQAGLRLTPRDLFQHPTVAALAALAPSGSAQLPGPAPRPGPVPLTPIQHWFFARRLQAPHHDNWFALLRPRTALNPLLLARALALLVARHDALRLRFTPHGKGWHQRLAATVGKLPFTVIDVSKLAPDVRRKPIEAAAAQIQSSLDLGRGPLLRAAWFTTGGRGRLLLIVHHLAVDGVSWQLLRDELETTYRQLAAGSTPTLPTITCSFQTWAEYLEAQAQHATLRRELGYWRRLPRQAFHLPIDRDGLASASATVTVKLDATTTRDLLHRLPGAYRTRMDDALLYALLQAFVPWTGRRELLLDLESHGREALAPGVDPSHTVGWLTALYPVHLKLPTAQDPGVALMAIKEQLRAVPRHGIGWGLLRFLGAQEEVAALTALPRPAVRFNYFGHLALPSSASGLFAPAPECRGRARSRANQRSHPLEIDCAIRGDRLEARFAYSPDRHLQSTMARLAEAFRDALHALVAHGLSPQAGGLTPSDFPLAQLDATALHELVAGLAANGTGLAAAAQVVEDVYPLAPMQEGMLFHSQLGPDTATYFEQLCWTLEGDLDRERWRQAWAQAVARHGVLRTAFRWQGLSRPLQIVLRQVALPWAEHDWRHLPATAQATRLEAHLRADRRRGLDFGCAPLLRLSLLRLGTRSYRFVWSFHHAILDGWSSTRILEEVLADYHAHAGGRAVPATPALPYRDFIAWIGDRDPAPAERFWRHTLAGFRTPTPLPLASASTGRDGGNSSPALQRRYLGAGESDHLRALARRHGLTLNTLVQGAWALLLARHGNTEEVLFGVTAAGRPPTLAGAEHAVGLFISTLPLRVLVPGNAHLLPWLQSLQQQQAALGQHQHASLAQLRSWSGVSGEQPLFESILVFQSYPRRRQPATPGGINLRDLRVWSRTNYPVALRVAPRAAIFFLARHDPNRLSPTATARLLGHLCVLLNAMATDAARPLSALPYLATAERHQLLVEWNDTAVPRREGWTVVRGLAERRAAVPDAVALVCGNAHLSYHTLGRRAERLAAVLRRHGVGCDTRIGLCVERSLRMVEGVLGILMAGAAYVPLDPAYPQARLAFMLAQSACPLVLTETAYLDLLAPVAKGVQTLLCLDRSWPGPPTAGSGPAPHLDDLAYVIYTSGSTGCPKGVAMPHRGLANLITWYCDALLAGVPTLGFASLSFDGCVPELFAPLCSGGSLHIVSEAMRRDITALARFLRTRRLEKVKLPTALLERLAEDGLTRGETAPPMAELTVSGELLRIRPRVRAYFAPRRRFVLHNHYGPSETHVVTAGTLPPEPAAWPARPDIGLPLPRAQVYVLDRNLAPVGIGVPGEVVIGGSALARGYLGRPGMTAARFIPDPFTSAPSNRLYKSGDLARRLLDGTLEPLGRHDHQVKIRGFRVEPGEIEAVLARHPAVREVAVVPREESRDGGLALVAYVALRAADVGQRALRRYLQRLLPAYMVPATFVFLPTLPLSPNRKVDRRALPAPSSLPDEAPLAAPRTPLEEILTELWCQILDLPAAGIHDSFFALGGHSLLAIRILARLWQVTHVDLPLRTLFEKPTIAALAAEVAAYQRSEGREGGARDNEPPLWRRPSGPAPLSFAQERFWFLHRLAPASAAYNLSNAYELRGMLDTAALKAALAALARRQAVLRSRFFTAADGSPQQVVASPGAVLLPVIDLRFLPAAARSREAHRLRRAEASQPFDLTLHPPLRSHLLRFGNEDHQFLVTLHHIASDGWSRGVLHRELGAFYEAGLRGRTASLPALPIRYTDYAAWQRETLDDARLEDLMSYWRPQLAGLSPLRLPADRPQPPIHRGRGSSSTFALPPTTTAALTALGRQTGVSLYMALLAVFMGLLHRLTGQGSLAVGSPIAGRERPETEGLIGCFVNTLVLRGELGDDPTMEALLARVRETALAAYAHQALPFEKLVAASQLAGAPRHPPLLQVVLALQSTPRPTLQLTGLTVRRAAAAGGAQTLARFDLEAYVWPEDGTLRGALVYNTDRFDSTTVQRWSRSFRNLLAAAAATPQQRIGTLPLLSAEEEQQLLIEQQMGEPADAWACLHQRFAVQAARAPDAVALTFGNQQLTYGNLMQRAFHLAHRVHGHGLEDEEVVGLCVERSPEMIIGLLAILAAGGAYLPLAPHDPPARLAFLMADAGVRLVITTPPLRRHLPSAIRTIRLEERTAAPPAETQPALPTVRPGHLAYVIYTSGSSGRPKGVGITHASATHLFAASRWPFRFQADDTWTLFHAFTFDFSVWELWGALLHGARLVGVPFLTSRDPVAFAALIRRQRVAVLNQTPAAIEPLRQTLGKRPPACLRWVFVGGEPLAPHLVQPWLASQGETRTRLVNLYGPTETTVLTTFRRLGAADAQRSTTCPIGRPFAGLLAVVVDQRLRPVPFGVPGELLIGGPGLSRGYLRRPGLTAGRFVPNPWEGGPGARGFRSGDRVRRLADGDLLFLDRLDAQVKVRGFRIEPGEVEGRLARLPAVAACAVVARNKDDEVRLVAYVVLRSEAPAHDLRSALAAELPSPMLPAAFVILDTLPLTANGKVDRHALPPPAATKQALANAYTPPRTLDEARLASIFAALLGRSQVGVRDDFFALGGHSLLALRLLSRIEAEWGTAPPIAALFQDATVAGLAAQLHRPTSWVREASPLVAIQPHGTWRPFFCVHPAGGDVLCYRALAEHLGTSRPFWGLRATGDSTTGHDRAVATLAAAYLAAIRAVQPRGPYYLGGWSMGGVVAFEMAQQLTAVGEKIACLALFDSQRPRPASDRSVAEAVSLERFARYLGLPADNTTVPGTAPQNGDAALARLLSRAQEAGLLSDDVNVGWLHDRYTRFRHHVYAMFHYETRPLPSPLTLFRAAARPHGIDPSLGWQAVAAATVEIVPGDHTTMLREPHVRTLAARLASWLERQESR